VAQSFNVDIATATDYGECGGRSAFKPLKWPVAVRGMAAVRLWGFPTR
jgi:hypothetical protein